MQDRIQTRFTVLNLIADYNKAIALYVSSIAELEQAKQSAKRIENQKAPTMDPTLVARGQSAAGDVANYRLKGIVAGRRDSQIEYGLQHNRKLAGQRSDLQALENANAKLQADTERFRQQMKLAKEAINRRINDITNRIPIYSKNVSNFATLLSRYGIEVSKSSPFAYVPALSMRAEVDAERVIKH